MLLPSHRHKPDDIRAWQELERADKLRGKRLFDSGKWRNSIKAIEQFASDGPCYCSVSWGKDSVVVAHLIHLSGLPIMIANVAQQGPGEDQYVLDVRDAYLRMFPNILYHQEEIFLVAIPDDGGHSPALDEGIRRIGDKLGTSRYIGGVRAEESGTRRMRFAVHGIETKSTCQPIGWWSTEDVFGWLAYHELPIHPNYAMLGGGRWDRKHIRVSTIGGPKGSERGRAEWEREYYGDVLRRIEGSRHGQAGETASAKLQAGEVEPFD